MATLTTRAARRKFVPGTTGWSVDDLDDPIIEELWRLGRYEIVEGVLTQMPAAYFDGGSALQELLFLLREYTVSHRLAGRFAGEVDLVLGRRRVPVVDAVWLSAEDQSKQKRAHAQRGRRRDLKYGRILIPPTLIIESLSEGHEAHDRETKRRWYAEPGVPNYWILDALRRSLDCFLLDHGDYRVDQSGHDDAELRPALFPGLIIPLGHLWAD